MGNASTYDFKNDDEVSFELNQLNFWKEKYDVVLAEKRKLDESNKKLENVLQESVIEQATLHKEMHKLVVTSEESAGSLRSHGLKIIDYIEQRGFSNSVKYHKVTYSFTHSLTHSYLLTHLLTYLLTRLLIQG